MKFWMIEYRSKKTDQFDGFMITRPGMRHVEDWEPCLYDGPYLDDEYVPTVFQNEDDAKLELHEMYKRITNVWPYEYRVAAYVRKEKMLTLDQLRSEIDVDARILMALEDEAKWVRMRLVLKWREMEQILQADEKAQGMVPWPDRPSEMSVGAN